MARFPLTDVLEYQNADVIDSFLSTYDMPRADAELLFEDVRRWMWLSTKARAANTRLFIDTKMKLFDEMWHTFVLFTRDYADFCEKHLGQFCHHEPTRRIDRESYAWRAVHEPAAAAQALRQEYTALITLVASELGEDVATRWFDLYRKRHTEEYIRSIHKFGKPVSTD